MTKTGPEYLSSHEKRYHDLGSATLLAPAVTLALPGLVALSSRYCAPHQSPLLRQKRIGQFGKAFEIYKLRTLWEENEDNNPHHGWVVDSRTDTIGNAMRAIGLDETAQLINVFKGDMSMIGVRPMLPGTIRQMSQKSSDKGLAREWKQARLLAKPGIWGPGTQIAHSSMAKGAERPVEDQMRADIGYIEQASFAHDTRLFATMPLAVGRLVLQTARTKLQTAQPAEVSSTEM